MTEKEEKTEKPEEENKKPERKLVQAFAVQPALMQETLDLLQNELPMSKCRKIVFALEQCSIVNISPQK